MHFLAGIKLSRLWYGQDVVGRAHEPPSRAARQSAGARMVAVWCRRASFWTAWFSL